jgi:hypothetical protein
MNRVLEAARLHVMHPGVILGVPWLVGLSSFAINELIWGVGHLDGQPGGTGGVLALYITVWVVFLQSVTQLFPFAMSLGLSRRAFYAGTAIMAVAQALGYAVVLTVLGMLEDASGGWWTGLHFFAPVHIDRLPVVEQFSIFFCFMLGFALLGIAIGAVHKRWAAAGLYALAIGTLILFGGAFALITGLHGWGTVASWFVADSTWALSAAYLGFAIVLGGGLGWTGLRRAVP